MTIAEHFELLGGHDQVAEQCDDLALAFRLWDSVRLWLRDRGTDREDRWLSQYLAALQRLERKMESLNE